MELLFWPLIKTAGITQSYLEPIALASQESGVHHLLFYSPFTLQPLIKSSWYHVLSSRYHRVSSGPAEPCPGYTLGILLLGTTIELFGTGRRILTCLERNSDYIASRNLRCLLAAHLESLRACLGWHDHTTIRPCICLLTLLMCYLPTFSYLTKLSDWT